jgi:hypothetical protein
MALIAHWPLNGNTNDISGNGYNGTPTNITYAAGKIGQAASFNGTNSDINVTGTIIPTTVNRSFSFSAWVYPLSSGGIITKRVGCNNNAQFSIIRDSNGALSLSFYTAPSFVTIISANNVLPLNQWTHFVITRTWGQLGTKFYINGQSVSITGDTNINGSGGPSNPLFLGAAWGLAGTCWTSVTPESMTSFFNGQINDARIYDHILTDMEIQEIARAKILHYSFDDFQEPTTNLVIDPLFKNVNDSVNIPNDIKIQGATGYASYSSGYAVFSRSVTPTTSTGKAFTYSIWMRSMTATKSTYLMYVFDGAGPDGGWWSFGSGTLTDSWTKYSATRSDMTGTITAVRVYRFNQLGTIDIAGAQLEQKPYSTEFVAGTRLSTIRDNSGFFNDSEIVNLNGYGYKVDHTDQYGTWVKIFNHNSQNNANLFANDAEAAYNDPGNQNSNKFSILNQIPNFIRSDNKYKFKLQYPDVGLGIRNIWFQTSNPNTSLVSGYQPISIENSTNSWGGLERTNLSGGTISTYIDGSVNSSSWWFSIGQKVSFTGGNPGPGVTVNNTSLYMCIEDTKFIKNYPKWIFNSKIGNGAYSFGTSRVIDTNIKSISPDSFSVSVWFKSSSTSLVSQFLLSNNRYGDSTIGNRGIELGPYSTGNTFRYAARLNNAWIDADIPGRFNDGNWHMATMVFTSGQNLKAYMDGQLIKTTNTTALTLPPTFESLTIGGNSFTNGSYFQGDIDNVHIYATALSDKDILDLYNTKAEIEQSGVLYARDFLSNAEETVNLLGIHSELPTLTGWDSYGFGSRGTREIVSVNPALSGNTIKVTNNSATNGLTEVTRIIFITPLINGNKLTVTGYVKGEGSSIGKSVFTHIYANSSEGALSTGGSPIVLTNNWQRITHTFTWTRTANSFSSCNIYFVANINIGEYFYVSNPQLEFKPYATPFISTFRPAIELPTGVQFGADEIHETGIANFEDFSTVGITDGLVGYWPLNGDARDLSGFNSTQNTLTAITWVSGKVNEGVDLNGTTSKIYINNNDAFNFTGNQQYTAMAMIYPRLGGTTWHGIFSKGNAQQWALTLNSPNGYLHYETNQGGVGALNTAFGTILANTWYHVAIRFNGTNKQIFINGVSAATQTATALNSASNTEVLRIGEGNTGELFNGIIDEVKVFNRALTDEEMMIEYNTMFNNQVQIHESGVVYARDLEQY